MIFTSSHPIVSHHKIIEKDGLSCVEGDPSELRFAPGSVVTIHSWGSAPFSSMEYMFWHCDVTILCDESPVFAPGCTLRGMFSGCANFNRNLLWDTSNVTDMSYMFCRCVGFNQNLLWDTSSVTSMCSMFSCCSSFNKKLFWDTSNVTNMSRVFEECTSFNQNLLWDTSKVISMSFMFYGCTSLRQNLD